MATLGEYLKINVAGKGEGITHTRITNKELKIYGGIYNISNDMREEFYDIYYNHIFNLEFVEYLTEKQPIDDCPIVIDLDFRYSNTITERQHTEDHIIDIIMECNYYLKEYYDLIGVPIEVFVMEKPQPNCLTDKTKDGVHILFNFATHKGISVLIRDALIKKTKEAKWFDDLPLTNTVEDVIDEGVINAVCNWLMYGSKKPTDKHPYKVVNKYSIINDEIKSVAFNLEKDFKTLCVRSGVHLKLKVREGLSREQIANFEKACQRLGKKTKTRDIVSNEIIETPIIETDPNQNINYIYFEKYHKKINVEKWDDTTFCAGFIRRWAYTKDNTIKSITHKLLSQSSKYEELSSTTNMTGKEWCDDLWNKYSNEITPQYRGDISKFYNSENPSFCPIYFNNIRYIPNDEDKDKKQQLLNQIELLKSNFQDLNKNKQKEIINEVKSIEKELLQIDYDLIDKENQLKIKYFEKFFCKLLNPLVFVFTNNDDLILYKENELISFGRNLQAKTIKKSNVVEVDFISSIWLRSKNIRTYSKIDFLPPPLDCPADVFNTFKGLSALKLPNVDKTIDYDFGVLLNHINILVNYDEASFKYVINYLAHLLQRSGEIPRVALVFKSVEGVGKNVFFELFGEMFLGDDYHVATSNINHLVGRFAINARKLLVMYDEAQGKDTFANSEAFKELITQIKIKLEKKGKDCVLMTNTARYLVFTNNDIPIKLTQGDRRFCVFEANSKYANNSEYMSALIDTLKNKNIMKAFYDYLMGIDISQWKPTEERPKTQIYKEIQSATTPSIVYYLENRIMEYNAICDELDKTTEEDETNCLLERKKAFENVKANDLYKNAVIYLKENNYIKFDYSNTKFGRDIKKYNGIENIRTKTHILYRIDYNTLYNDLVNKNYIEPFDEE
jgi:hypothetical protein